MSSANLPSRPLKSTALAYNNPGQHAAPPFAPVTPPLPPGWTIHKAPSGHTYYYNAETKISTYTRPVTPLTTLPGPILPQQQFFYNASLGAQPAHYGPPYTMPHGVSHIGLHVDHGGVYSSGRGRFGAGGGRERGLGPHHGQRRPPNSKKKDDKPDRPKKKQAIPRCEPWVLVTTKLGRTFVHNLNTKESLWKAPEEVQKAIEGHKNTLEVPDNERKDKEKEKLATEELEGARIESGSREHVHEKTGGHIMLEQTNEPRGRKSFPPATLDATEVEAEEEEAEEEEEEEDEEDEEPPSKRVNQGDGGPIGPVEFTEEDVDWQLQAMAEEYGLVEEDLEGEELPQEDALLIFKEMLDEHQINPYSTWETEYPKIVDDGRYTVLNTTKQRKSVFDEWCRGRIAELKKERETQKKIDPRVIFWNFLVEYATPKLYWPEFKRKYKKNPEMKDAKLTDKDREKMYREYILHIKASEELRENDLKKLLKSTTTLTRNTPLDDLPTSIIADVRYVVAPKHLRDDIVLEYISKLPDNVAPEERKALEERERKEQALRDRQRVVRREQARFRGDVERGRELLREEEAALERAKSVGKKGLLSQITIKKGNEVDTDTGEKGIQTSS